MDSSADQSVHALAELYGKLPSGYTVRDVRGAEYTYGELTSEGAQCILRHAEGRCGGIRCFVDLGSGTGKIVLLTTMLLPKLCRSIGVELCAERHAIALAAHAEVQRCFGCKVAERAVFLHEDSTLAVATVANADVIWVSNLCLSSAVNQRIAYLIDMFAQEGTLVYSLWKLPCMRKKHGSTDSVFAPCSWNFHQQVFVQEISGVPSYALAVPAVQISWTASDVASKQPAAPDELAALAGHWRDQKGARVGAITGDTLSWAIGLRSSLSIQEEGVVTMDLHGKLHTASMVDGRIKWSNGDVWERLSQAQHNAEQVFNFWARRMQRDAKSNKDARAPTALPLSLLRPATSAALLANGIKPETVLDALLVDKCFFSEVLAEAKKEHSGGLELHEFRTACEYAMESIEGRVGRVSQIGSTGRVDCPTLPDRSLRRLPTPTKRAQGVAQLLGLTQQAGAPDHISARHASLAGSPQSSESVQIGVGSTGRLRSTTRSSRTLPRLGRRFASTGNLRGVSRLPESRCCAEGPCQRSVLTMRAGPGRLSQ